MKRILIKLEHALPFFFWLFLMLGFDSKYITVLTLLAALLHELGHISVYLLLRGKLLIPLVSTDGFRLKPKSRLSYREEAFIALGGPLLNLLCCLILFAFDSSYTTDFAFVNLLTAISNLLPISGYDGYRMLNCLICLRFTPETAERVLSAVSLALSCVLCFISLFFILKVGEGYWIFGIFFASVLGNIFKRCEQGKCEI